MIVVLVGSIIGTIVFQPKSVLPALPRARARSAIPCRFPTLRGWGPLLMRYAGRNGSWTRLIGGTQPSRRSAVLGIRIRNPLLRPAEPETASFLNVPLERHVRLEPVVAGISVRDGHSNARYTSLAHEIKQSAAKYSN